MIHKGPRRTDQLYIDQHIIKGSKRFEKYSYGVDWDQKCIQYRPEKLDERLSQNEQDIRRCHKIYREYHGKLKSGTEAVVKA